MRFFDDEGRRSSPAANVPRGFSGSAKRIDLEKRDELQSKLIPEAWQTAAWSFYDAIGELHFAFNLVGQILSQIRLYAAIVDEPDEPPIRATKFIKDMEEEHEVRIKVTEELVKGADEAILDLMVNSPGMGSGILRELGINLSVAGEAYLIKEKLWTVASTDEIKVQPNGDIQIQRTRRSQTNGKPNTLPKSTFVARIWRSHPRYSAEADSSMIGVLESCEQLLLLTQAIRMMTRSRMNAGIVFIPDGLTTGRDDENPESIEEAIIAAAISPLEEESAATSVVPLVVTGPAALGKELKKIDLGRPVDEQMVQLAEATLDRILQGIDIPKSAVQGLADVKYANAIVIDDNLYRAHIEPLALMIVDALTQVYLRPVLRKNFPNLANTDPSVIDRMVVWFDPSDIVTRPDRSQAANEGYDRNILSAEAWRSSRGFNDHDAPDAKELLIKMAMERTQIPPDMAALLIESILPEFFQAAREEGQEEAGVPDDISSLLEGGQGMDELGQMFQSEPAPAGLPAPSDEAMSGGELSQGGNLPPREGA